MKLAFLSSNRFWAIVGVAIIWFLNSNGWMPNDAALAITTILLGHVGIRTVDRLGEKIGER